MRPVSAAAGASAALVHLASAQSFFKTCDPSWYVELTSSRAWMHATCRSRTGTKVASRLDLNYCVGNNNGKLVADDNGRFGGTCQDCLPDKDTLVLPGDVELPPGLTIPGLTEPSSVLMCSCRKKDNSIVVGTTLDLNDVVGNSNGVLNCYGHTGQRT